MCVCVSVDLIIQHGKITRCIYCTIESILSGETKISKSSQHVYQFQKKVTERKTRVLNRPARMSVRVLALKIIDCQIITTVCWFKYKVRFIFVFFQ